MIDDCEIRMLIEKRRPFIIGTRGICIKCYPLKDALRDKPQCWIITIPRAFVSIYATDISILDDADYYDLTFQTEPDGPYYSLTDLRMYDKLTVIQ